MEEKKYFISSKTILYNRRLKSEYHQNNYHIN